MMVKVVGCFQGGVANGIDWEDFKKREFADGYQIGQAKQKSRDHLE